MRRMSLGDNITFHTDLTIQENLDAVTWIHPMDPEVRPRKNDIARVKLQLVFGQCV